MVGEFDAYVQDEQEKAAIERHKAYLAALSKGMSGEGIKSFEEFCEEDQQPRDR